jgi:hypothetical protein
MATRESPQVISEKDIIPQREEPVVPCSELVADDLKTVPERQTCACLQDFPQRASNSASPKPRRKIIKVIALVTTLFLDSQTSYFEISPASGSGSSQDDTKIAGGHEVDY